MVPHPERSVIGTTPRDGQTDLTQLVDVSNDRISLSSVERPQTLRADVRTATVPEDVRDIGLGGGGEEDRTVLVADAELFFDAEVLTDRNRETCRVRSVVSVLPQYGFALPKMGGQTPGSRRRVRRNK